MKLPRAGSVVHNLAMRHFCCLALVGIAFVGQAAAQQVVELDGRAEGKQFDGIGVVNGGGATSVLLKDYPEPQRSQILDLVFKPKFGASVSALLVEIPGDGNSTQGSMPSHMHTRDDLNYQRGYIWWILREAKKRNAKLTLDGTAWSAPGWVGKDPGGRFPGKNSGDAAFWSQDTADYYVTWLRGLRDVYGLELDAIGCRNEKGVSIEFAKRLRKTLDAGGFQNVKLHAFDNWPKWKLDFLKDLGEDEEALNAIDIVSAHTFNSKSEKGVRVSPEVKALVSKMNKPIWNSEEHVYKKGFDCAISIVQALNDNFITSGATKIVVWYDIAGVYRIEPYSEDPAMILARSPWSGHYHVREALWGYAHYGQFTEAGWRYLEGGCGTLAGGGTFVSLKSAGDDYSVIIETSGAKAEQTLRFKIGSGLSDKELCVWRSNAKEQFVQQAGIEPKNGEFAVTLEPESIYSLSTTRGQQKGSFDKIPEAKPFPFPYYETFDEYLSAQEYGYLPRYTADIAGAFEIAERPDGQGKCIHQVVPTATISWAPDWMPYTILGDEEWKDYEVSAEVYLNRGDSAGVMGRVNHVGTGYGFVPKGYILRLADDGQCELVVVRGKKEKKTPVGDAEQQALIAAGKNEEEGGEKVLATARLASVGPNEWRKLTLRFEGESIKGLVDGAEAVTATDALYARGMVGLLAVSQGKKISTPYFDNLLVKGIDAPVPEPTPAIAGQAPIYQPTHTGTAARARIVVVGDSTVCDYPQTRPERGWGMFIQERFQEGAVEVINLAASGRSTKTFISEGRWQKALDKKPDYVLIQFGHNDSHDPSKPESTDAATDYRDYLRRYIDDSRAIGATPILVTPMVRRTFDADGKLKDELARYAAAMKEVGLEKKAAVIDLHASSKQLVEQLGPAAAAELANKTGDATHFNEKGAKAMAELVIRELPAAAPKLKEFLKSP